ncbi:flagellar hook-length control protein FliK [Variovorax ginsengisoli]|uniref:Flagellar hook-length control protein-like C-terminal domain-containing protein n=1 Tax=Variovorax ginsengisoli TaxID=363844 RepID=A0ABT9SD71_9BURK|nr:flagellar hook-length control protein FliK [Variovorax ginsengisoli]MDP9902307.1 hypothetical protein [Variovorax ginsengisoli]
MTGITRLPETLAAARVGMLAELIAPASGGDLNPLEAVPATRRVADNALLTGSVGRAGLPPAQTPESPAPGAPQAQWSATARVITALLTQAGGDPAPVQGSTPLWTGPRAPVVPQLAATLAQTVAVSGLFYESHLSDLALAVRSVAELRLEPQARLSPGPPGTPALPAQASMPVSMQEVTAATTPVPSLPGATPNTAVEAVVHTTTTATTAETAAATQTTTQAAVERPLSPGPAPAPEVVRLRAMYGPSSAPVVDAPAAALGAARAAPASERVVASSPPAEAAAPIVHPQAVTLVNQQLDLLATQVFRWNGQAWPGVQMDWSIQPEDDPRTPAQEHTPQDARRWSTQVSLTLPAMGMVDVRLALAGQGLHATVRVHDAASVGHCRDGVDGLQRRLAAAGFHVHSLQIEAGEP